MVVDKRGESCAGFGMTWLFCAEVFRKTLAVVELKISEGGPLGVGFCDWVPYRHSPPQILVAVLVIFYFN